MVQHTHRSSWLFRLSSICVLCMMTVLSYSVVSVTAHVRPSSVSGVTIHSVATGSTAVTISDRRSDSHAPLAECVFEWSTSDTGPRKRGSTAPAPVAKKVDENKDESETEKPMEKVLAHLEQSCVSSVSTYWTYELCFGKSIKQFHDNDVYMLARADGVKDIVIEIGSDGAPQGVMSGGDLCSALNPPAPRQVTLAFVCRANAMSPQMTAIRETSTCKYLMQIATVLVCGDPRYTVLPGDGTLPPAFVGATPETGSEDWYVELVEIEGGLQAADDAAASAKQTPILMCQAYSLEYRASSVKTLRFSNFRLQINWLSGSNPRSDLSHLPVDYRRATVRQLGRQPLHADDVHVAYGVAALAQEVGPDYDGNLALVKVYA